MTHHIFIYKTDLLLHTEVAQIRLQISFMVYPHFKNQIWVSLSQNWQYYAADLISVWESANKRPHTHVDRLTVNQNLNNYFTNEIVKSLCFPSVTLILLCVFWRTLYRLTMTSLIAAPIRKNHHHYYYFHGQFSLVSKKSFQCVHFITKHRPYQSPPPHPPAALAAALSLQHSFRSPGAIILNFISALWHDEDPVVVRAQAFWQCAG